jgi:hypothetical protein
MLGFLGRTAGRAGYLRILVLGLMIGMCVGIMAGRVAERFRLSDFVAIEKMILERERPPQSRYHGPPRVPSSNQPFQM